MLYTLTTNPAIDMNMNTVGLLPNQVNRTLDTVYSPNGKGVNVSLVLDHYQMESTILGFFGGFTGKYIVDELEKRKLKVLPTWIEGDTRINIFVNDGEDEFKLVNSGSFVNTEYQERFLQKLKQIEDMEVLVISGSLPPGIDSNYYDLILKICQEKGTKVILDISSEKLSDLLNYQPYLIKPNDDELEEIFGLKTETKKEAKKACQLLHRLGAENILLTRGEKGSYFSNGKEFYSVTAQKVNLVSSACAGDASLAAFLSIWLKDSNQLENALKCSAATGANVAESHGLGDLKKVESYMKNIKVEKGRLE